MDKERFPNKKAVEGQKADLTGANLSSANLTRADLIDANLTRAYLTDANLTNADLTGANLTGANLTDANLSHAGLDDANLTGANLTGANLTGATLIGVDLTDATGENEMTGAYLRYYVNLNGTEIAGGTIGTNVRQHNFLGQRTTVTKMTNLEKAIKDVRAKIKANNKRDTMNLVRLKRKLNDLDGLDLMDGDFVVRRD